MPSFDAVVGQAALFVLVEVVAVRPGRQIGDPALPFTSVDLLVSDVAKGSVPLGGIITLEQTGGVYAATHAASDAKGSVAPLPVDAPGGAQPYPPPNVSDAPVVLELRDDPLLRVGDRAVLALLWKPDLKLYQLVGPQGRFNIDPKGRVHPVWANDPAVIALDGLSVEGLMAHVRSVAGK